MLPWSVVFDCFLDAIFKTYSFGQEDCFFTLDIGTLYTRRTGVIYSGEWRCKQSKQRGNTNTQLSRTTITSTSDPDQFAPVRRRAVPVESQPLLPIPAHDASYDIGHWLPGRLRVECDGHRADLQTRGQREGLLPLLCRPREFEGRLLLCGMHTLYSRFTSFCRKRITN